MAAVSRVLPVPAAVGVGASVDISDLGPVKSVVVGGTFGPGEYLIIEGSNDPGVVPDAARTWDGVAFVDGNNQQINLDMVLARARVRRKFASAAVLTATLDGDPLTGQTFLALSFPAGPGVGPAVSVAGAGPLMSFVINGTLPAGDLYAIEGSNDGAGWVGVLSISQASIGANLIERRYDRFRVRRIGFAGGTLTGFVGAMPAPGGGGSGQGLIFADSVESVGVRLTVDVDTAALRDGTQCYVGNETFAGRGSIRDYVELVTRTAGLPADAEGEVFPSATEGATRAWLRCHVPCQIFLDPVQAAFWAVTGDGALGTAIIDNDGFSDVSMAAAAARPISAKELNRRGMGFASRPLETTVQIEQVDDLSAPARAELEAVVMTNWYSGTEFGYPMWRGRKVATYTGVVTAYATAVPAANTGFLLSAVGLGNALGANKGRLVMNAAGTKVAFAAIRLSADQVRVTQPSNGDPVLGFTGVEVAFAAGETISLFSLPGLPVWPWAPNQHFFPEADGVHFTGTAGEGPTDFGAAYLGDTAPFVFQCEFTGGVWGGGPAMADNVFSANWFHGSLTISAPINFNFCGAGPAADNTTGELRFLNCIPECDNNTFTFESSSILCRTARFNWTSGGVNLAFFNVLDGLHNQAMVRVDEGGGWDIESGFMYGSGNTARIFRLATLVKLRVQRAGIVVATTFVHPISVENGEASNDYDVADISINAVMTDAQVIDPAFPNVTGPLKFSGAILTSAGGAVTTFLSDAGSLLSAANQVTPQRFQTSKRRIYRMRVTKTVAPAGSTSPVVVTLMKNSAPTAQTITIPFADPVGTKYVDAAHPIAYADGDDFDTRATAVVEAGVAGSVGFSVVYDS